MTEPFTPIGPMPRRFYVVEWAESASVGAVITYDQLAELMDTDSVAAIQGAVRQALKVLEADHLRTLENVPGVGYRLADAAGHLRLGRAHRKKSGRALKRGLSKVENIDYSEVRDPELVRALEAERTAIDTQLEVARRAAARVARVGRLRLTS